MPVMKYPIRIQSFDYIRKMRLPNEQTAEKK